MNQDQLEESAMNLALGMIDRKKVVETIKVVAERKLTNGEIIELAAFMLTSAIKRCPRKDLALVHFGQIATFLDNELAMVVRKPEDRDELDRETNP